MDNNRFAEDFELFNNDNLGSVRTAIDETGQAWFVARDICDILDIQNAADTLKRLDEDEKQIVNMETAGGMQNISIVNEAGMFSIVLSSRKQQAKDFKRWLTHDVIPAIREHGGYIYGQERLTANEKEELNGLIDNLSMTVNKYKKRWHELNADKKNLKDIKRTQKKTIKGLNDYANTLEKMYNGLYEDFKNTYEENIRLKDKLYETQGVKPKVLKADKNSIDKDYIINAEGMLIKKSIIDKDYEREF